MTGLGISRATLHGRKHYLKHGWHGTNARCADMTEMTLTLSSSLPLFQLDRFNNSLCTEASKIYTNWAFMMTLSLVVIFDVISIFLLSFVLVNLFFSKAMHIHLKILTINVCVAFVIRNSLTCLRAGYFVGMALVYIIFKNDPCMFVIEFGPCRLYSDIAQKPQMIIIFAIQFLVFERLIATLRSTVYENIRRPWIPLSLVASEVMTALFMIIWFNRNLFSSPSIPMSYCSSITTNGANTREHFMFFTFCFVSLVVGSVSLLVVNRQIRLPAKDGYSHVSTKYQLLESRLYTSIFTYCNLICGTLTMGSLLFTTLMNTQKNGMDIVHFAVAKEISSMVMPIYGCVLGICFFVLHRPMRASLRKKFACGWRHSTTVAPTSTASDERLFFGKRKLPGKSTTHEYFQYYQQQWN